MSLWEKSILFIISQDSMTFVGKIINIHSSKISNSDIKSKYRKIQDVLQKSQNIN